MFYIFDPHEWIDEIPNVPIQRYPSQANGWAESAGTQDPVELDSPELLLPYRQDHAIDKHGLC